MARATFELGGKSPAIVLDDYDIGPAAECIAGGVGYLTGQVCHSLTRVIVSRSRHDEMVEAMSKVMSRLRIGDPFDPASDVGPLATAAQLERVENYIKIGQAEGAQLAFGGGRPSHLNHGYYIEPTIFANVDNSWRIAQEEIFGPVICVIPSDSEEQAIAIANDTQFGLNSSVFTQDPEHAMRIARQIRAGTVGHNGSRRDFAIAFGGFKMSGIGREGGIEGLQPFVEPKTVVLETPYRSEG
jgi:betaine-aldehyde dehydrogenase